MLFIPEAHLNEEEIKVSLSFGSFFFFLFSGGGLFFNIQRFLINESIMPNKNFVNKRYLRKFTTNGYY